jgi:RNA recognition motif-containing protein
MFVPKSLWVTDICRDWPESKFREIFEPYGPIERVDLPEGRHGRHAYAFVHFEADESVEKAIAGVHGRRLDGFTIGVHKQRVPKTLASGSGNRSGSPTHFTPRRRDSDPPSRRRYDPPDDRPRRREDDAYDFYYPRERSERDDYRRPSRAGDDYDARRYERPRDARGYDDFPRRGPPRD